MAKNLRRVKKKKKKRKAKKRDSNKQLRALVGNHCTITRGSLFQKNCLLQKKNKSKVLSPVPGKEIQDYDLDFA